MRDNLEIKARAFVSCQKCLYRDEHSPDLLQGGRLGGTWTKIFCEGRGVILVLKNMGDRFMYMHSSVIRLGKLGQRKDSMHV